MRRKTLYDSTDDHDNGAGKDGASSSPPIVDNRNEGEGEDSTERIRSGNDTLERACRVSKVCERREHDADITCD
jgi:hypothetical protein